MSAPKKMVVRLDADARKARMDLSAMLEAIGARVNRGEIAAFTVLWDGHQRAEITMCAVVPMQRHLALVPPETAAK